MKKALFSVAACAMSAACLISASACSGNSGAKLKVIDIELTSEEYAFAVSKNNGELLDQINGFLAEWKNDGSLDALINSYFSGEADFSYTNKTASAQSNDFVVATNAYFPPFESYNDNSAFVGVDIEIAYNIAKKLGKTLYISDMDFDSIIPNVQKGVCAIGMAGITVNETRKEQVDFTTDYYTSAQVLTVLESDTTFDNCTTAQEVEDILKKQNENYIIGTQAGTTGYMYSFGDEAFDYPGFKNLKTKGLNTGALAMMDLRNGKLNAVMLDKQPSLMIVKSMNK